MQTFVAKIKDADNKHGIDEAFVRRILSGESLYKLSKEKQCSYAFLRLIKQGKIYKDLVNKCGGPALESSPSVKKPESAAGSSESPDRVAEHTNPTHHQETIKEGERQSLKEIVTNPAKLKELFAANGLSNLDRWLQMIARSEVGNNGSRRLDYEKALKSASLVQVRPYKIHEDTPEKVELSTDALFGLDKALTEKIGFSYSDKVSAELVIEATSSRNGIKLKTVGKSKFRWLSTYHNFKSRAEKDAEAAEAAKGLEAKAADLNGYIQSNFEHIKQHIIHLLSDVSKTKLNVEVLSFDFSSPTAVTYGSDVNLDVTLKNLKCLNKTTNEHFEVRVVYSYVNYIKAHDSNDKVFNIVYENLLHKFVSEVGYTSHSSSAAVASDEIKAFVNSVSEHLNRFCKEHFENFSFELHRVGDAEVNLRCHKPGGNYDRYLAGKAKSVLNNAYFELKITQSPSGETVKMRGMLGSYDAAIREPDEMQQLFARMLNTIDRESNDILATLRSADSQITKNKEVQDSRNIREEIENAVHKCGFSLSSARVRGYTFEITAEKEEAKYTLRLSGKVTETSTGGTRGIYDLEAISRGRSYTCNIARNMRGSLDALPNLVKEAIQKSPNAIALVERQAK